MRRHVFFIAGFDPKGARYYHALYRREARRQSRVSELRVHVGTARSQPTPHSSAWALHSHTPGDQADAARTTFELLQWDDIVRAHWSSNPWRVLADGSRTVLFGLMDGAVQHMFRLFRPPVIAVLLPLAVLLLCAAAGLVLAWLLGQAIGNAGADQQDWPRWLGTVVGIGAGAVVALGLPWLALVLLHRAQLTWLLRLVRFTHLHASGGVPALDQRMAAFGERIAGVLSGADPPDEVLLLGHSAGATLAVQVLAQVIDRHGKAGELTRTPARPLRSALTLLSLGHCIPLMSALSPAHGLRRDLQRVANAGIEWVDISSPIDWAAFPGIDPMGSAGLPPAPGGWRPRLISPQFHRLFGAASYARLKRNRFRVHLQYLMAAELPGRFDYFAITAGPSTLRERWAQTPPGPLTASPE